KGKVTLGLILGCLFGPKLLGKKYRCPSIFSISCFNLVSSSNNFAKSLILLSKLLSNCIISASLTNDVCLVIKCFAFLYAIYKKSIHSSFSLSFTASLINKLPV